jgi:hypothetical protein
MPPNLSADPLRALRRVVAWAMFAGLVVGLPLQALSSTLAGMLGPRHAHPTEPAQDRSGDPMAGWKDFRRASDEHPVAAAPRGTTTAATAHRHAHEAGLRHHHDQDDADVIDLEAPADGEGAPAGAVVAMAVDADRLAPPPRSATAGDEVWRAAIARSFDTPFPRRIERPPSRS